MRRITIRLLGPFEVTVDNSPSAGFPYAKVRALLAYLAVESRPHSRAHLAALLWPDQPEHAARASLSQALTILRNALGDKIAERPALLTDVQHVRLDCDAGVTVDVTHFLATLRALEAHAHRSWRTCGSCSERLRQVLALYRGAFLADLPIPDSAVFEEWATQQREHLVQRVQSVLERLVARAQWRGAYTEALAYAQQLVALDPLIETNQRTCMRLLALSGETAAAVAQYKQLHSLLAQELDDEPEAATTDVFEQIRSGAMAALRPPQPPFVVPQPPSPLVGRSREVQDICERLQAGNERSLTITGAGGIGKSRLALEAAQALRYDFEDGVFFVELAALNDAALVADTIARVLGITERPHQHVGATLRDHLRAKHVLLILDNFEHVISSAPLVGELLAACPALTVLVTSRAPLTIRYEQQVSLEPLADADAVQLFVQRAHAVGVDVAADDAGTSVYAAICRRLDRLPLAIELAAARSRFFSPPALLERLNHRLALLTGGARDLPLRQQTLRNTIDWSYNLLDESEQTLFARLAVFVGGSPAAVAAVCGPDGAGSVDPLAGLASLVDKSMLQQETGPDGEPRFVMLEILHEHARERLEARGAAEQLRRLHAEYFVTLAEAAESELEGSGGVAWLQRLETEHGNIRAALEWSTTAEPGAMLAMRLAGAVWRFWEHRAYLSEGRRWLERVLASSPAGTPAVRAKVLTGAGTLAWQQGDFEQARAWHAMALQLYRETNDALGITFALTNLGVQAYRQGDYRAARTLYQESLAGARAIGDKQLMCVALNNLGLLLRAQGEYGQAVAHYTETLDHARELGNRRLLRAVLLNLGEVEHDQANYPAAITLYTESLVLSRNEGNTPELAYTLCKLAEVAYLQNDLAQAMSLLAEAQRLLQEVGETIYSAETLRIMGDAARARGEYGRAATFLGESLALCRKAVDQWEIVECLESFARLAGSQGQFVRAARLWAAAGTVRSAMRAPMRPCNRTCDTRSIASARAALGEAAFAAAWVAGTTLSLEQAIDDARNGAMVSTY